MPVDQSIITNIQLAKHLGGTINGSWINISGPGHSKYDRSLGFRFDPTAREGIAVFSLAGDNPEECRKLVQSRLQSLQLKVNVSNVLDSVCTEQQTNSNNIGYAKRIWNASSKID